MMREMGRVAVSGVHLEEEDTLGDPTATGRPTDRLSLCECECVWASWRPKDEETFWKANLARHRRMFGR